MELNRINKTFGLDAKNRINETTDESFSGAIACLETFYYAFNNRDLDTFKKIWLNHELIQLNNPLGGIIRGIEPITELYDNIFNGQARVWVELTDVVCFQSKDMVTFAGRENGEFSVQGHTIDLQIRTTRFFGYSTDKGQWFQLHHHGSIDNVELLDRYQKAVRK
jgi:hypothetical protein